MPPHSVAMTGSVHHIGQNLVDLALEVGRIGDLGDEFKRERSDLVRRIGLLFNFFEEIRDFGVEEENRTVHESSTSSASTPSSSTVNGSAASRLSDLGNVIEVARRLLILLSYSSSEKKVKGFAHEWFSAQFQFIIWKLEEIFANFPYHHFSLSEEVKEQVELVYFQVKRAKERNGPLNWRSLSCPLSVLLDEEIIPRVLSEETSKLQIVDRTDACPENVPVDETMKKINLLEKEEEFENLGWLNGYNVGKDNTAYTASEMSVKNAKQTHSWVIPDEFRCPISLDLMRDPVTVATGQTYERSCIQRWINCGNCTCPKTQQKLPNMILTPNCVLKNLIKSWCQIHQVEPKSSVASSREDRDGIDALVFQLLTGTIYDQREAAAKIRFLSRRSTSNRILIAEAGAIPVLIRLLTTDDLATQEHVVTSILNLSIYEANKRLIMEEGAITPIIQVLRLGTMEARENAAATIFSLSLIDEYKIAIGVSGAIKALIELLERGSTRGKKDASTALFNLCMYKQNKGRALRAGIVSLLMKMVTDSSRCVVDEALAILSILASHKQGKMEMIEENIIPIMVDIVRTGLPRNKENAAAILVTLYKRDIQNLAYLERIGAVNPLTDLVKNGTDRAKRKAACLLEQIDKVKHSLL